MKTIKRILKDTKEIDDMKSIVSVYEEIAATKMQSVRKEIVIARDFYDSLSQFSSEVGADLENAGLGKTGEVAVFVSSQTGLYGEIIDKIFVEFSKFVSSNPSVELVVFGKSGDTLMKSLAPNLKYKYFDLLHENVEGDFLAEAIKDLVSYKKIHLFYGKFNNIVSQECYTKTISGQVLQDITPENLDNKHFYYLYEPSIEIISKILTEQIAGSVFNQSLKESLLAKLASRLMYLDDTLEKCDEKMINLKVDQYKTKKRISEKKQSIGLSVFIQ